MRPKNLIASFSLLLFLAGLSACAQTPPSNTAKGSVPAPASDPSNAGGWVLNEDLSDEFEGTHLDPDKWFIEGQNGEYYIWKGRSPAQFIPENVILEDGKLKLRTKWEPDYPFDQEGYSESGGEPYGIFKGEKVPVTTAGVVTKKRFLNGYMEVKSKAGAAAITAAFWAIGYEQELDIYEQMGAPKIDGTIKANSVRTGVHDWSPPAVRPTKAFGYDEKNLDYNTSDGFHIYGAEWGVNYLKVYRDGKLTYHITQDELGTDWVLNNPMEIWLDSEAFNWLGLPHAEELPVDFEIEYLRVWQKPSNDLLDRAFYGFEGPILFEENGRPLMLLPESSVPDDYQKFWLFDTTNSKYLAIVEGDYASGVESLAFKGIAKGQDNPTEDVVLLSPEGAVDLEAGQYVLSAKVWLDQGRAVKNIYFGMENAGQITIPLKDLARREWITVKQTFTKTAASSDADQFRIQLNASDFPKVRATGFFIDDIQVRKQ